MAQYQKYHDLVDAFRTETVAIAKSDQSIISQMTKVVETIAEHLHWNGGGYELARCTPAHGERVIGNSRFITSRDGKARCMVKVYIVVQMQREHHRIELQTQLSSHRDAANNMMITSGGKTVRYGSSEMQELAEHIYKDLQEQAKAAAWEHCKHEATL